VHQRPVVGADGVRRGGGRRFDGRILRAYDAKDGAVVWSFDVGQAMFQPLNASTPMKGDTMNSAGASVAGGTLFQISGYQPSNPRAMNLLLAFTVDGK
jgi:outer membrane protein assembly factor BamB